MRTNKLVLSALCSALFIAVPYSCLGDQIPGVNWSGLAEGSCHTVDGPNLWGAAGRFQDSGPHTVFGQGVYCSSTASIGGQAQFGRLVGTSDVTDYGSGNYTTGYLELDWQDTMIVTSKTLPNGAPVKLKFALSLHDILGSTSPTPPPCSPNPGANCSDAIATVRALYIAQIVHTLGTSPDFESQSFLADAYVGEHIDLAGNLHVDASACTSEFANNPNNCPHDFAESFANAGDTSLFGISVLTPGAGYTTLSGHQYSITPEPGSLVLIATALLGLAPLLRRRSM